MERITAEDIVKMGLGTMLVAKEKVESFVDEAMKQGDLSKDEGAKFLEQLKAQMQDQSAGIEKHLRDEVHRQLKELGIATKEDIASLRREITALKHELQKH